MAYPIIIKTTFSNLALAKKMAKLLITKKLAACVQLSKVESFYFWQKEISNDKEILLSIKTMSNLYQKIEKVIIENHQYKNPQVFSCKIDKGAKPYLDWIKSSCE